MKTTYLLHWLAAAAVAAALPVTGARAMSGRGSGGFAGGGHDGFFGHGFSRQIDLVTISLIADSFTTIGTSTSFTITTGSSSVSTSLRLAFRIGGTPTTTTDTLTTTPLMITRPYTITGIGTV